MSSNSDFPFKVGDEVEATFTDEGYRGAWFRCQIEEISYSTPEPSVLLKYLDFTLTESTWLQVRKPDESVYIIDPEKTLEKKNPLMWVVRPPVPVVRVIDVDDYLQDIGMGRRDAGFVYVHSGFYVVGDSVDFRWEDCFWEGLVVEVIPETNEAKVKFPDPPAGEGDGTLYVQPFRLLRPSFTWNPEQWWRRVGLEFKNRAAGTSVEDQSHLPYAQLKYLSDDAKVLPAVLANGRCQVITQGETSSVRNSEHNDSPVVPRGPAKKPRLEIG